MAGRETRQYWIDQLTEYWGGSAKSRNRSFCVLRKPKTGNFSVVTLRAATLKIPGFVLDGDGFVLHAKRLEHGSFLLPKTEEGRIEFSGRELARGKILFSRSGETASAR